MLTIVISIATVVTIAVGVICYRFGKVYAEARVVSDFNEIIGRVRDLVKVKNYAGLDLFLHDLTEDAPPSRKRHDKNYRPDKGESGLTG